MRVKAILSFLLLLFVALAPSSAKEPIKVNSVVNSHLGTLETKDQIKLKKAITTADKFMKLYLGTEVCGCEPSMKDCKGTIQPLLDYPLFDPKLDKTCGVQGENLTWKPNYIIDTDGHIVSIEINNKDNTVLFKYESTLVGICDISNIDSEDGISYWDISIKGQRFKSEVKINLNNYKVLVASTQNNISPFYYDKQVYWYINEILKHTYGDFTKWSNGRKAEQRELAKKILKDLDDYKHQKSTNPKQK